MDLSNKIENSGFQKRHGKQYAKDDKTRKELRILNAKTRQQKRQTTEKYVKRENEVKRRYKQEERDYIEKQSA
mgnify:CR=1 FL=1